MSSSVSNLQLLNNTEHRVKFKTGLDISNVLHSFNNIIPDLGSGGNNGTLVNGNEGQNQYTNFPERSDDVPDAANKYSVTSVMFDGVNDYMDTGVSIIEDTSALSMSAWVFLNSAPADYDQVVAIRGYGAYPGAVGTARALGFYEGKLHFNTFDSLVQGTTVLSTGNWYHIAGTVTSDGTAKVYLNGVLEGSGTVTMNPINNQNTFTAAIGATTEYIPAKIDEVSLWDSVLTDGGVSVGETAEGDIAKLYNNGNPNDISALNPLGWWPMGEHLFKDPLVGEIFLEDSKPSSISLDGSAGSISTFPYFLGGYLDLNSNFQSLLSDSFALSMWVKLTDTSELTLLFGASNQANSDRFYGFHSGGVVNTFYNANGSSNADGIALTTSSIDLTSWTHLLFTYQNRWTGIGKHDIIHTVYANGVNIGTVTKTDPTSNSSMATYGSVNSAVNLFIGARNNWGTINLPSTGLFDQIALFNLAESEVSGYLPAGFEQDLANSIWNNGVMTKINSLNPFGLWDMNNKSVKDKGSGANNGTLYNGSFSTTDMPPNENPALYTCTNKQGTISKVSGNLVKMGGVPMLRTNSNEFIPNAPSPFNGGFSYSFWFYDDVTQETGGELLFFSDVGGQLGGGSQNSYVAINYSLSQIEFRQHVNRGNVTFHNSSVAAYGSGNAVTLTYGKNKLNNILITKEATSPFLTKFYFNSELVAECSPNTGFYPGNVGLQKISSTVLLIGDLAYWDTDISSISDEVYSPNEGHKGFQGDWRNLSIPPEHYWKLGSPMDSGEVKDLGADGTNHFIPNTVSSDQYEYKNIFGIDRSGES
tara:strand:+ start:5873 stop:8317 length:2445 start_codon:yes stop_codon:yes gene_type:complete